MQYDLIRSLRSNYSPSDASRQEECRTHAVEHLLEVGLGVDPAGDGVTEEDEVGDDAVGVQRDHVTHAAERRVLLLVVSDVTQRRAPGAR